MRYFKIGIGTIALFLLFGIGTASAARFYNGDAISDCKKIEFTNPKGNTCARCFVNGTYGDTNTTIYRINPETNERKVCNNCSYDIVNTCDEDDDYRWYPRYNRYGYYYPRYQYNYTRPQYQKTRCYYDYYGVRKCVYTRIRTSPSYYNYNNNYYYDRPWYNPWYY